MKNKSTLLWIGFGVLLLALMFARALYPDTTWLTAVLSVLLLGDIVALIAENRAALKGRTTAFGVNSVITTVLVIALVGVANFLVSRYPQKADLTKSKLHTLSDQTVKIIKGLQQPVKAVFFAKVSQRDQFRTLLENLKDLNPKFELEYVDPDKEPTRAKEAAIKKYQTLMLQVSGRENKIEEPTEEKVTNALIKLLKPKSTTLCAVTGHGEKSMTGAEADGFSKIRQSLIDQAYEVKDINLVQEAKVPESCDLIAILGPTKSFFDQEAKLIRDYLDNGGRALVSLEVDLKGGAGAAELKPILESWYIKSFQGLIVDPVSRLFNADASVAIIGSFSKENSITKDMSSVNCFFPLTMPLQIIPGAPPGLNVQWITQTNPNAWGETNLKSLAQGQVSFDANSDIKGPMPTAIAVQGKAKDSKATKSTRLVVFGSTAFANNNFSRLGANLDLFMNAVSWITEEENLISIRPKEDAGSKLELSNTAGRAIFVLTVIVMPLLIAAAGIVFWAYRRRL